MKPFLKKILNSSKVQGNQNFTNKKLKNQQILLKTWNKTKLFKKIQNFDNLENEPDFEECIKITENFQDNSKFQIKLKKTADFGEIMNKTAISRNLKSKKTLEKQQNLVKIS